MRIKPDGIRVMRYESGLSQRAFAVELGVSSREIGRWETGECAPSPRGIGLLIAFAKARGLKQRFLFADRSAKKKELGMAQVAAARRAVAPEGAQ